MILILLAASIFASGCTKSQTEKPNVLLIIIDTLSAKHLEVYDDSLNNAPNLSNLAKNGIVFERAYSSAPWTKPSIASVFTGQFPRNHTVTKLNSVLPKDKDTMSEYFKEMGYETSGVISHTLLKRGNGYEQGFEDFKLVPFRGNVHDSITSDKVTDIAIEQIDKHKQTKRPFFQFIHYFDPHFNYQHHQKFDRTSWYKGKLRPGMGFRKLRSLIPQMTPEDQKYLVGLYHEEIAFTDEQIGRLLEHLKSNGLYENSVIVVTADHGEEFLDHGGLGHTRTLYDELIRVPLIISWLKTLPSSKQSAMVGTIDLFPSLIELTGGQPGQKLDGLSLFKNSSISIPLERKIFSEVDFKSSGIHAHKSGVIENLDKLIFDHLAKQFLLFDLSTDPKEDTNVFEAHRKEDLEKSLDNFIHSKGTSDSETLEHSKEELDQLKSLGYL